MNTIFEQLIETDKAFAKMSREKGAEEAFAYYLTRDAVQLPQGQPEQIGNIMKTEPGETFDWEPQSGKVSASGDMGYTWGKYVFTLANGKEIKGKYLNVWSRQGDGTWKVMVDMGNS